MTWAVKLFKMTITAMGLHHSIKNRDAILVHDLVLGVLEKNKEIEKEVIEVSEVVGTQERRLRRPRDWRQARAFRELVEACKEVKKWMD